ncbi:hypothetical protein HOY80DRAFT_81948 [Tuber brumale]|nr:hypothetical protein HOY80DRAFT_81948 [Tuber brumale]
MPAVPNHPIGTLLLQVEKRDYAGDKRVDYGGGEGPVAIVGLVVAALTLLVAIASLRSSRFRRWLSDLLPSRFVKKNAAGITPTNLAPTVITTTEEELRSIRAAGIPTPRSVVICNHCSNVHPACRHTNTSSRGYTGITREDGRVSQTEESLGVRRPEPGAAR